MTGGERFLNQVSSLGKQIWRSPAQLEPSTPGRGEFAERGPLGVPETPYRNGLAAQQSAAAVNAWRKPASWLRTEVELVSSAAGEIESIRVISTCGVKKLDERPDNDTLLKLYALYKQGSVGDNTDKKPGFGDMVGRAKWDAWNELKGKGAEDAMQEYVDLIESLKD